MVHLLVIKYSNSIYEPIAVLHLENTSGGGGETEVLRNKRGQCKKYRGQYYVGLPNFQGKEDEITARQ